MRHIERGPAPPSLDSPLVKKARDEATKFFSIDPGKRKQKRHKFFPLSTGLPDFANELQKAFHSKCAFCESYMAADTLFSYSYMDRFRPKSGATGLDGKSSPDHYWWLAYEWTNLYLCCLACNKIRGQRFPVKEKRVDPKTFGEDLRREQPLLLDPCEDFPEDHLVFDEKGFVASDSELGRITIESFGLNRGVLISARAEVARALKMRWNKNVALGYRGPEQALKLADESLSFLCLRRQLLQQWSAELILTKPGMKKRVAPFLKFRTGIKEKTQVTTAKAKKAVLKQTFDRYKQYQVTHEKYSVEKESQKGSYYLKSRLVERVVIRNFRIISDLAFDLPVDVEDQGYWLLLLGENGTGKSTALAAMALALMGDAQRRKFLDRHNLKASDFVRFGCDKGRIDVFLTATPEPITLTFNRRSKIFQTNTREPKLLLLAYGATRLLPHDHGTRRKEKAPTNGLASKVDNLFDPFSPLNDAESWLCSLREPEFDFISEGLKQLLLLEKEQLIKDPKKKGRILVKGYRSEVPLDEMSAGFQSVVALTADVMSILSLRWETMELAEGIVLIDEIDAHLHPRWRMQIVSRLRKAFPRLQFVVTSHDPLCLRGLHAGEVVVMKRDHRGRPIAITDLPAPDSLRVDQILTSEFFGLNSTVEPEIDKAFERYYKLLAIRQPSPAQLEEIAKLKSELRISEQLGTTRRERVMLEAVDTFLAQHDVISDEQRRAGMKQETKDKIVELWKTATPAVQEAS